ncbi:MAG TPA: M14 family metallopeptidase [Polyangiaceae bacterium]|nr:M14 family metallopeptidase [Polyangiaceae bacterium]
MTKPRTIAEASGFRATSTHAEVMSFIAELEALGSRCLRASSFGKSPEGRVLPLLVMSSAGAVDPAAARALGRPVVLIQNCIHAGEVEGKESALMLARDLLGGANEGLLEKITLLVVPIFNPDGNDAMDTKNRALDLERLTGQDGPARVGTRVNAQGINLNRDYIRHDALEMRLLQTRVCQPWEPDLTVDTHATNGSVHRFAMTHDIPHTVESGRPEPVEFMRRALVPAVSDAVRKNFGLESGWYGNFVEDERALDARGKADPSAPVGEGWMTYPHHPRFGSNYRGLGGRLDLLLECYSYASFEERVRATYAWLLETVRAVAERADAVREVVLRSRAPRERIAVSYRLEALPGMVDILTRDPRTQSGAPHVVRLPHLARFVGETVVDRPRAYLVPSALESFLRGHGLRLGTAPPRALVEVARFEGSRDVAGRAILEASGTGQRRVSWSREARELAGDALVVVTDQPLGALAVYLCEPESDDGIVENGLLPTPPIGEEFPIMRIVE